MSEVCEAEFKGVRECDVFVCLLPGLFGTHSELGAAVALGKKVLIHGIKPDNTIVPCYYADNVKPIWGGELELVAEILNVKETA